MADGAVGAGGAATAGVVVEVPSIGISVLAAVADDRQVTFQCYVGSDEPPETANALVDRMLDMADRQTKRYAIVKMRAEQETHRKSVIMSEMDEKIAQADFARMIADLDVQIGTLQENRTLAFNMAYDAFTASGKKGEFEPVGRAKAELIGIDAAITKAGEDKLKAENEKIAAEIHLSAHRTRAEELIALLDTKIAEAEAVLSGK